MSEASSANSDIKSQKHEYKRPGYTLCLEISPDKTECRCSYQPGSLGGPMTHDELRNFMNMAKVVEGVDSEAILTLLTTATSSKPLSGLLLASGTPMTPGEDGILQLEVSDAMQPEAHATKEGNETVDMRVVQQFHNVTPGQLVATIIPPGDGLSGMSVHGTVIPPLPGKPMVPVLGPNVCLGEDGRSIYAESEGRVVIKDADISVENILSVKGNLDFKVGNIVFNGFVEIKGDVLDDFSIKATKGIKVQGNIGLCSIESQGDISFCGMSGQGKGVIKCGGNINANFINDVTVECDGDVLVESEIRNCRIHSLGSIRVNKGVLAGGDYVALGGIESSVIGTVTSLRTHIAAGVNYRDQEELNCLFQDLKELINNYTADKNNTDIKEFVRKRAEITDKVQQLRTKDYPGRNPKVNVKKKLYEMVIITLGTVSEDNREERQGPISIIENTIEGGFRYLNMTDLKVKVEEIERAFVQQHELQKLNNTEGTS